MGNAAIEIALATHVRRYFPDAELFGCSQDAIQGLRAAGLKAFPITPDVPTDDDSVGLEARPDHSQTEIPAVEGWVRLAKKVPLVQPLWKLTWPFRLRMQKLTGALRLWPKGYRFLGSFRLLIIRGGGQISDTWEGAWNHPYALFRWAMLAKLRGTRLVVLSVGAEAIKYSLSRWFLRRALLAADYRSFRDVDSREVAVGIGVKENNLVYPDLAFSLEIPPRDKRAERSVPVVGVSPMAYGDPRVWPVKDAAAYQAYLETLAAFVIWLGSKGYKIVLFSSQIRHDPPVMADLQEQLRQHGQGELASALEGRIPTTVDKTVALLHELDFVVASRLHGVLLSHLAGTPVLAVSYEQKIDALMRDLGLSRHCLDIRSVALDDLKEKFSALVSEQEDIRRAVSEKVARYKVELEEQYKRVFTDGHH
jgi:polysaccharide pyruvyl transferase WcaK-like protein